VTVDVISLGDRAKYKGKMYVFIGYKWFDALSSYLLLLHPLGERSDKYNLYCCRSEVEEVFPSPFSTIAAGIQFARFAGHKCEVKAVECLRNPDGGRWDITFKWKVDWENKSTRSHLKLVNRMNR